MTSDTAADDPQLSRQGSPLAVDACSQKKINENNRRSNKPIMEKKRRARINNCLNELKTLILDATKKDPARHSKLEKADILEMTVKHLESMQRHNVALSAATGSTVANKFKAGFNECSNEVNRFPGLEPNVRKRLMQHLGAYFNKEIDGGGGSPRTPPTSAETTASHLRLHLHDHGRNAAVLLGTAAAAGSARGVQLVPTRLANGDIALVLPSATTPPGHALPLTPPSVLSDASGTESPAPDRPSSCCSSGSSSSSGGGGIDGSGDSAADAYDGLQRSDIPLALVTKRRRDDEHSDLESPWRPW